MVRANCNHYFSNRIDREAILSKLAQQSWKDVRDCRTLVEMFIMHNIEDLPVARRAMFLNMSDDEFVAEIAIITNLAIRRYGVKNS